MPSARRRSVKLIESAAGARQAARLGKAVGPVSDLVEALERIAHFDHSVSIPDIGSLFHFVPTSPLGQDQQQLADAYGVPFAWPSTSGTTPLNSMALLTVASPGDTVLIQRDCHTSVYAPLIHLGLRPVYVVPPYVADLGLSLGVTPEQLAQALDAHPQVRAVVLTYPNYFGIATDIAGCARVVLERRCPLIIDAAHGAHLRFHPSLPYPAEDSGATIITQSTHKTGSALSQGSLALFNDEGVVDRFYEVVNELGFISTSFSYVILQSIMLAVLQLKLQGEELLGNAIGISEHVRAAVNRIDRLSSFGVERRQPGFAALDPLRVTVDVSRTGLSGYAVAEQLMQDYQIYPELATLKNVLLLFTLADEATTGHQIVHALQQIVRQAQRRAALPEPPPPPMPRQLALPREAFFERRRRRLPVREAIGLPSAETIATYPPGCPIIVGGEELSSEIVGFLQAVQAQGGVLKGATDPTFTTITVVE